MEHGFGNMLKGRIVQVCGNQTEFTERLNKELAKRGEKPSINKVTVSAWCKLNPQLIDAMSEVLGADCRSFFTS